MKRALPLDRMFFLAGPTGCGKTAVAIELAHRCNGEIVNADAFQVYRGLEILAATPTEQERTDIPHHFFSILSSEQDFDAAQYAELVSPVLTDIVSRGCLPIIVGGSGLYMKALTHGLSPTPPGSPDLRQECDSMSLDDLVKWLHILDPEAAESINLKNRRYVTRALEITLLSGKASSELKAEWQSAPEPGFHGVFLSRQRDDLYQRINQRTEDMFEQGVVEEIGRLGPCSDTAEKAIGLREIRKLLEGSLSSAEVIAAIQQATRRYAKRQSTWYRREKGFQTVCIEPGEKADSIVQKILSSFNDQAFFAPVKEN